MAQTEPNMRATLPVALLVRFCRRHAQTPEEVEVVENGTPETLASLAEVSRNLHHSRDCL